MANTKKYVSLDNLTKYDEKIKKYLGDADAATLASANQYFEDNADRFDEAGAAATAEANAKTYADGKDTAIQAAHQAGTDAAAAAAVADGKAVAAQTDVDNLEKYVGTIPTDEKYADIDNVVSYINKKAEETLSAAQGGSSETAASVKQQLDNYKSENDTRVKAVEDDIKAIKDGESLDSFADVETALAGKQDVIPENTYDAYGSAATAESNAKTYTEEYAAKKENYNFDTSKNSAKILSGADSSYMHTYLGDDGLCSNGDVTEYSIASNGMDGSVKLNLTLDGIEYITKIYNNGQETTKDVAFTDDIVTYGIEYDSDTKEIKLVEGGSETAINATDFIKDGMIESVALSEDGLNLVITWNTDSDKGENNVTTIPLSGLVDVYTGVDGTTIKVEVSSDDKVSAEVKTGSLKDGHIASDAAIAKGKLASDVQTSLGLADSAVQEDDIADLRSASHTHDNKALLDTYDQTNANIKDAVDKKHSHTFVDSDVNDAISKKHEHSNFNLLETYTQTEANLADAVSKKHEHSNVTVLNGITSDKVAGWDNASSKVHEHSNKGVLDGIDAVKVEAWDNAEGNAKSYADSLVAEFVEATTAEIEALFTA